MNGKKANLRERENNIYGLINMTTLDSNLEDHLIVPIFPIPTVGTSLQVQYPCGAYIVPMLCLSIFEFFSFYFYIHDFLSS